MGAIISCADSGDDGDLFSTFRGSSASRRPIPTRSDPDQVVLDDGGVLCADWCRDADNHPFARSATDQICRSHQFRLQPTQGGGRSGHTRPADCRCCGRVDCPPVPWADASVIAEAEQFPGEPPAIVLAIDAAGVEQHVHLTIDEADELASDLFTLGMRIEGTPA